MTIKSLEAIQEKIKKLPTDIRLEVLLGELLANKIIDKDKFQIHPKGLFSRNYRKDIESINLDLDDFGNFKKAVFNVTREGLFDALPKGLFIDNRSEITKTNQGKLNEYHSDKDQEEAARVFFLPFEQAFYHSRLKIEQEERNVVSGFSTDTSKETFSKFWNLKQAYLDAEHLEKLFHVLPLAYRYKGNLAEIETLYSAILQEFVKIEKKWDILHTVPDELIPSLGNDTFLGFNTVLGNTFQDGIPTLQLSIGPMKKEVIVAYLPDKRTDLIKQLSDKIEDRTGLPTRSKYNLLNFLNRYFLPAEGMIGGVEILLKLYEEDKIFKLDETDFNGRLGYTTYLSEN